MDLSLGNIYSIPESPSEELSTGRHYSEISFPVSEKLTKDISIASLPDTQKTGIKRKENYIPTLITTEKDHNKLESVLLQSKAAQKYFNRLTVSLLDFSDFGLTQNNETIKADKQNALSNMSHMISGRISKSYLNIQDCTSYSNHGQVYETLLSPNVISNVNLNQKRNSVTHSTWQSKAVRQECDNLVFIDLNSEDGYENIENRPNLIRQRASSMQWIQSAFQNISNKYKDLLEFRRPSDIVEERIRKSNEGIDMEESETEVTTDINQNSSAGARRFSENIIGKQKRFPFVARLGHLKGIWKDRNVVSKRQEEKDIDQTRTDVCPLFTFPRKRDEDELILDTLRQAMRKCTAVDPISRPSSRTVLENLSNLLKEF